MERNDTEPREERTVHRVAWVFRCCANEVNATGLHMRQYNILLRGVEPVDLINEEDCGNTEAVSLLCPGNHFPHVRNTGSCGTELLEGSMRCQCNDP